MEIVFAIILLGSMFVCSFILGGIFARHLMIDALDEAREQRQAEEYYRLAGYQKVGDPRPYVPPTLRPRAPRGRYIPGLGALDRLLREGKRGTIMVRGGEQK